MDWLQRKAGDLLTEIVGGAILMILVAVVYVVWALVSDASIPLQVAVGIFGLGGTALFANQSYGAWIKWQRQRHSLRVRPAAPLANAEELAQPYVRALSFRILELVGTNNVVVDKTFEDCDIAGPAILAMEETVFADCVFLTGRKDSGAVRTDAFVWEIRPERTTVVGVVVVRGCVFRRCRFLGIGFAGDQNTTKDIMANMGDLRTPAVPSIEDSKS